MSLKEVFFKDTIIYGLTSYLGLVAAFFLTPIYTRILTKSEFGMMDLFHTWNNFFVLLLPFGLTIAVLRFNVEYSKDEKLKKKYLGTLFATIVASCGIYVALMVVAMPLVRRLYFRNEGFNLTIFYISLLLVIAQVLIGYFQALNRIEFKKYSYLAINLASFFLLVVLGFVLVYVYDFGVLGFFIASLIALYTSLLLAIAIGYRNMFLDFDFSILRSAFKYSIYLLLVTMFLRTTYIIDRTLINNFLGIKEVGEYSIVIRVGHIVEVFIGGFATAWFPYAMSLIGKPKSHAIYRLAFRYYLILFSLIAFLFIIFLKEILLILAPSYLSIEQIGHVVVINAVIAGVAPFFGLGIHITKKTQYFLGPAAVSSAINIGLSIFLVQRFGLLGIALGSFVSLLFWVGLVYLVSNKISGIRFDLSRLANSILLLLICSYLSIAINNLEASITERISGKIVIATTVIAGILYFERASVSSVFGTVRDWLKNYD